MSLRIRTSNLSNKNSRFCSCSFVRIRLCSNYELQAEPKKKKQHQTSISLFILCSFVRSRLCSNYEHAVRLSLSPGLVFSCSLWMAMVNLYSRLTFRCIVSGTCLQLNDVANYLCVCVYMYIYISANRGRFYELLKYSLNRRIRGFAISVRDNKYLISLMIDTEFL